MFYSDCVNFISTSEYYKSIFSQKVYKISLDAGCTCPTRDGTKGTGGCIFCSASGSGDFASSRKLSIKEQVEQAKKLVINKIPKKQQADAKFIAYFQNFSNTYGNEEDLLSKFNQAINEPNIVGLSIATRPDCLSENMIKEISNLKPRDYPKNKIFHISIELGFQTSKESSAIFIRRGYENSIYIEAIKQIHKIAPNIHVITHLIFGLPEETIEDMLNSVRFVLNAKTDGVKFTVLHILEGTDLATLWKEGKIKTLTQEEYFDILKKSIQIIEEFNQKTGKNIVIHRLTGDGAKKILLSPMWTADKKKVLNSLTKFLILNLIF